MSNGKLITRIHELMEEDKIKVDAYRRLTLESHVSTLEKQEIMDEVALVVKQHGKDIDKLQKRGNVNDAVTAIVTAFAAIVGIDK